jgi:SAM-dependent methyltransferase
VLGEASRIAVGIDHDPAMLALAGRRLGGPASRKVALVRGDARQLPLATAAADVVLASTLLCFLRDPAEAIHEMARVCRRGGRVVVGELNPVAPWQLWRRLEGLLGAGSFREAHWHAPPALAAALDAAGCRPRWVGRGIFSPPLDVGDVLGWRTATEWVGRRLWPWAGAYYVIAGERV